ncbi:MAG: hypothetical protein R2826_00140 [Thermoleophilia bacterium]
MCPGFVPSGSVKGYCYTSAPPGPVVADLDHARPADGYAYADTRGDINESV